MHTLLFLVRRSMMPLQAGKLLRLASLVAGTSVLIGSMALILALAILDGFERELRENAVTLTAHIEITGFGKRLLPARQRVDSILRTIPHVRYVQPFIAAEAIARSSQALDGVQVRGLEPHDVSLWNSTPSSASSQRISTTRTLVSGAFAFSSPTAKEVIVGAKLARKLALTVGKLLTLYSMPATVLDTANSSSTVNTLHPVQSLQDLSFLDVEPIVEQFRVVGIYETGMSQYDDLYVYVPLAAALKAFKIPDPMASGFGVLVDDVASVRATAEVIEQRLGYPFFVRTLYEMYDNMFAWIELQKEPVPLILGLISIVAAFNIIAALFMAVVQKMPSIGVLRALGMKRRTIVMMFVFQGLILGGMGTLLGSALGGLLCWIQHHYKVISLNSEIYFLSAVPIASSGWHYVVVIGTSLVLSILSALIPAVVGARVPLLRALKFQ
jgi:lipoprotein-releasing system permease protein